MSTWNDECNDVEFESRLQEQRNKQRRRMQGLWDPTNELKEEFRKSFSGELVNSWAEEKEKVAFTFSGIRTYSSRWLYPFARLLLEQPKLNDYCLMLSNPAWFSPFFNTVTLLDSLQLDSGTFNTKEYGIKRTKYPQSISHMLTVLNPKDKTLRADLKQVLHRLFRTKSLFRNCLGWVFAGNEDVPYTNLDIFVKFSLITGHPNLVKVSLGGLYRPGSTCCYRLAAKLKTFSRLDADKIHPMLTFYEKYYLEHQHIFKKEELPFNFNNIPRLNQHLDAYPVPILESYVDLNREHFLQKTFRGRWMFSWYKFTENINSHLSFKFRFTPTAWYSRNDLPKLESKMIHRFPEVTEALYSGVIQLESGI